MSTFMLCTIFITTQNQPNYALAKPSNPHDYLIFYLGKQVRSPSVIHSSRCCLISSWLYFILLGSSLCVRDVITAIANTPQSVDPVCCCIDIMIMSQGFLNPNTFMIVVLVSASNHVNNQLYTATWSPLHHWVDTVIQCFLFVNKQFELCWQLYIHVSKVFPAVLLSAIHQLRDADFL